MNSDLGSRRWVPGPPRSPLPQQPTHSYPRLLKPGYIFKHATSSGAALLWFLELGTKDGARYPGKKRSNGNQAPTPWNLPFLISCRPQLGDLPGWLNSHHSLLSLFHISFLWFILSFSLCLLALVVRGGGACLLFLSLFSFKSGSHAALAVLKLTM